MKKLTKEIKDLEGNVIEVGDRIAAAFRTSTQAYLRTGTVLGFGERSNNVTLKVQWDYESIGRGHRTTTVGFIDSSLFRFVKIGSWLKNG